MELFDAGTVDLVGLSPDGVTVCLDIVSDFEWTGSDAQISSLQSKIHAYVGYVLDGQLAAAFPDSYDPPWQIVLRCHHGAPDARTGQVLPELVETVRRYGGDLVIQ